MEADQCNATQAKGILGATKPGRDKEQNVPQRFHGKYGPADILILDFQPAEV